MLKMSPMFSELVGDVSVFCICTLLRTHSGRCRLWFRKHLRRDDAAEALDEDVTVKLTLRRLTSCMHHCQSARFHSFCLASCLAKITMASRFPVDVGGPAVSAASLWETGALRPRPGDCRTSPGDQSGTRCDGVGRPVTDAAGMDTSLEVVGSWPKSPETRPVSKRGYNDVVDLCIAYNCPNSAPGSLQFIRCVRQFHCM